MSATPQHFAAERAIEPLSFDVFTVRNRFSSSGTSSFTRMCVQKMGREPRFPP